MKHYTSSNVIQKAIVTSNAVMSSMAWNLETLMQQQL